MVAKLSLLCMMRLLTGCGSEGAGGSEPPPPTVVPPPTPVLCTHILTWTNPTEDTNGQPLDADELVSATLYAAAIPYEPMEWDWMQGDMPAYGLTWEVRNVPVGTWHYELTVSNLNHLGEPQESDHSNTAVKECP